MCFWLSNWWHLCRWWKYQKSICKRLSLTCFWRLLLYLFAVGFWTSFQLVWEWGQWPVPIPAFCSDWGRDLGGTIHVTDFWFVPWNNASFARRPKWFLAWETSFALDICQRGPKVCPLIFQLLGSELQAIAFVAWCGSLWNGTCGTRESDTFLGSFQGEMRRWLWLARLTRSRGNSISIFIADEKQKVTCPTWLSSSILGWATGKDHKNRPSRSMSPLSSSVSQTAATWETLKFNVGNIGSPAGCKSREE